MLNALEIVALFVLVFWCLLRLDRRRWWPRELFVDTGVRLDDGVAPRVTAVVPARNEADVLPVTLESLLSQDLAGFRVVLVDDASEDDTAGVARRVAHSLGRDETLSVLTPPPRPPGWTGKLHALNTGIAKADTLDERGPPDWLLLTDADIRHPPGSIVRLLAKAGQGPYDLVSVMARLYAESFWERLLIPPFVFFFHLLYPFRLVARPDSPVAAAAGGCILVRRRALAAAGGLAALSGALIDDVALARAVQRGGGRLWLGLDPDIASHRPYGSLAELWRMVARTAFVELDYRVHLLVAVLVGLLVLFVAPPILVAVAGVAIVWDPSSWSSSQGLLPLDGAGDPSRRLLLWAGMAWGLQALALLPYVRHHRVPAAFAVTLPVASFFYGLMTLSSGWNHLRGRGSVWKGRQYS